MHRRENGPYHQVYGQSYQAGALINGLWHLPSAQSPSFKSINPACPPDCVGDFLQSSPEQLQAAHASALALQPQWQQSSQALRQDIRRHLRGLLRQKQSTLTRLLIRELGWRAGSAASEIQQLLELCQAPHLPPQTHSVILLSGRDFPLREPLYEILRCLASGRTIIWKPAQQASACAALLTQILMRAGLPAGVLSLLPGDAQLGQTLLEHTPSSFKLIFMGRSSTAQKLPHFASLKPSEASCSAPSTQYLHPPQILHDLKAFKALCLARLCPAQRRHQAEVLLVPRAWQEEVKNKIERMGRDLRYGDPSLDQRVHCGPVNRQQALQALSLYAKELAPEVQILKQGKQRELRMSRDRKPSVFIGDPDRGFFLWPLWIQLASPAQTELSEPQIPDRPDWAQFGPALWLQSFDSEAQARTLQKQPQPPRLTYLERPVANWHL